MDKVVFAFDLGGVIFDFDYNIALSKIQRYLKVPSDRVIYSLFWENFTLDYEKGLISAKDFFEKFKRDFCIDTLEYEYFLEAWCDIFSPKDEVIRLIRRLRLFYPVYLISNINEEHFKFLYTKFPHIFDMFDDLILSYQIKSIKPEYKIYEEVIRRACDSRIIYIDDRKDLIDVAQNIEEFLCFQFTSYEKLNEFINNLGIILSTEEETEELEKLKDIIGKYKNPLILGIGNTLRGDDGAGKYIAQSIEGRVNLNVLSVDYLENSLGKIEKFTPDLIVILDAGFFDLPNRWGIFYPDQLTSIPLYTTHNFSLKYIVEYLQRNNKTDIIFFTIKIKELYHNISDKLSQETEEVIKLLVNFFVKEENKLCIEREKI